jgi:hypothetical protein
LIYLKWRYVVTTVTNIQVPFRRGLFGWPRNRQIPNKEYCCLQLVAGRRKLIKPAESEIREERQAKPQLRAKARQVAVAKPEVIYFWDEIAL